MLALFPSGHSDLGCGLIPGACLVWFPRLECPGAEGTGSMWQTVRLHKEPRVPLPSAEPPKNWRQERRHKKLGDWS